MILFTAIITILLVISFYCLYLSIKRNFEFIDSLEQTNDQIDETLEILDYYYKRFDKKSKLDLFSDDQIVRELVQDIKHTRNAIMLISKKLTGDIENTENPIDQQEEVQQ